MCKINGQVYSGYFFEFFPCSSEIFPKISLKIRTKVLQQPSRNELTASTNKPILHHSSIYIGMTTTTISRHLTMHLASSVPRQHTLIDYQQQLACSSEQYKKYYFWTSHNKSSTLKPSYEIFSDPLTLV